METKSQSVYVPGETEQLDMSCESTLEHTGHEPSNATYLEHLPYTVDYEEMTPNSTGSRNTWKPFEHYYKRYGGHSRVGLGKTVRTAKWGSHPHTQKSTSSHPNYGYTTYGGNPFSGSSEPFGDPGSLNTGLPVMYAKRSDGGFVPAPDDLDELMQRSLNVMMPHVKEELSILNSIYELKDFKRLPRMLTDIRDTARRSSKWVVDNSRKVLRQYFRSGAEVYLTDQFALRPLIGDIVSVFDALSRTEKRMNALITRSGRTARKHFAFNYTELGGDIEYEVGPTYGYANPQGLDGNQWVGTFHTSRSVEQKASKFHAMIEYNYNYSQYQLEHSRLLSLLDAFGVNLNPAIIWNAIPWSFVVDWLVSVNSFLDQTFKLQNMEPTVNVLRYLWSIKRERTIRCVIETHNSESEYPGTDRSEMPTIHEVAYRRWVGMPNISSLETSGLSAKQVSLGAALVVAQRRRPRKRVRF